MPTEPPPDPLMRLTFTHDGKAVSLISRRVYLILAAMHQSRCGYGMAAEAVSSVALEHPDWDLSEERSWEDWEREA